MLVSEEISVPAHVDVTGCLPEQCRGRGGGLWWTSSLFWQPKGSSQGKLCRVLRRPLIQINAAPQQCFMMNPHTWLPASLASP